VLLDALLTFGVCVAPDCALLRLLSSPPPVVVVALLLAPVLTTDALRARNRVTVASSATEPVGPV
jgi:hypothetical protein